MRKWARSIHYALTLIVFLFLDLLDTILCVVCHYLDEFFEGKTSPCYCAGEGQQGNNVIGVLGIDGEIQVSESLYRRKNPFRETGFLGFPRQFLDSKKKGICDGAVMNRWSDCGCESCVSWINCRDHKLHVEVRETSSQGNLRNHSVCLFYVFNELSAILLL